MNELILPAGKLAFNVVAKIAKAHLSSPKDAEAVAIGWLKKELPERLAKANHWNFFGLTWIEPEGPPMISDASLHHPDEQATELTAHLLPLAEGAIAHIQNLRESFEAAKSKLGEFASTNTALGFTVTAGEARSLLRTIEGILDASADMGGYEASRARAAAADYAELARRKNEVNHLYQNSLHALRTFVYRVDFPSTWCRRP
ncbi:hypothetical protein [Polaromonas sp. Pch-P]|uniref:hypothetical protein n=1 Tax=Polaromonas sp. Pch-P TaxID=2082385 RepID=UPI00129E4C6F|nr:hypothetical protein [Polaromonas sp. Pch-P]QGJ17692.1 hypothetical protein F7R28_04310 [Polaromonas sp. Pch-P]